MTKAFVDLWWVILVGCACWLAASGFTRAQAPPAATLAGSYTCTGANPDGDSYHGRLLAVAAGPIYRLVWPEQGLVGIGFVHRGVLTVGFSSTPDTEARVGGRIVGVVVYDLIAGGVLDGQWTAFPGAPPTAERCVPLGQREAKP